MYFVGVHSGYLKTIFHPFTSSKGAFVHILLTHFVRSTVHPTVHPTIPFRFDLTFQNVHPTVHPTVHPRAKITNRTPADHLSITPKSYL